MPSPPPPPTDRSPVSELGADAATIHPCYSWQASVHTPTVASPTLSCCRHMRACLPPPLGTMAPLSAPLNLPPVSPRPSTGQQPQHFPLPSPLDARPTMPLSAGRAHPVLSPILPSQMRAPWPASASHYGPPWAWPEPDPPSSLPAHPSPRAQLFPVLTLALTLGRPPVPVPFSSAHGMTQHAPTLPVPARRRCSAPTPFASGTLTPARGLGRGSCLCTM